MGLLDGLIDILVGGLNRILGEGFIVIKEWLVKILGAVINPIIQISIYAPAPQPKSGILFGRPVNSPWGMIYDMYWETMLPIGLLLLFVSYLISRAGAAWGLGPATTETKSRRGLYRGLVLLPASWYLVVAFLRFNRTFAGLFAPDGAAAAKAVADFSYSHPTLGGAAFALLITVVASLSLFAYLFLVIIHILRITAIFLIVYSLPLLLGLDFGQYPYLGKYSRTIYSYLPVLAFISIPVAVTFRFSVDIWEQTSGIAISGITLNAGELFAPLFMLAPAVIAVLLPVMMVLNAPGMTSMAILGKGSLRDRREKAKKGASKARDKAEGAYKNWHPSPSFSLGDPRASSASTTGGSSAGGRRHPAASQLMPPKQTPSAIERRGPPGGSSSDRTLPPGDSDGQSNPELPEGPDRQTESSGEPAAEGQLPGGGNPQPTSAGTARSQGRRGTDNPASQGASDEELTDISTGPVEDSSPSLDTHDRDRSEPSRPSKAAVSNGTTRTSERSEPNESASPPQSSPSSATESVTDSGTDTGTNNQFSEGLDDYLTEEQLDLSNRDPVAERLGTSSSPTQQQATPRRKSRDARRRERERRREQHRETYVKNIEQFDEQPDHHRNVSGFEADSPPGSRSDTRQDAENTTDDDTDQFAQRDAIEDRSGPQTSNRLADDPVDLDSEDYTIDEDDQ